MKRHIVWLGLVAVLAGCTPPARQSAQEAQTTTTATTTTGKQETATGGATGATANAPVPESLKHDGYAYYGLERKTPVSLRIVREGAADLIGAQKVVSNGPQNGAVSFTVERSGDLTAIGNDQLLVDDKGVWIVGTTLGELKAKSLEMPAKLAPGTTWTTSHDITKTDGSRITDKNTFKVLRSEPVKTQAGTFDALLITSSGDANEGTEKFRIETRGWYVKGRGAVKMEIKRSQPGAKASTMTIEETP